MPRKPHKVTKRSDPANDYINSKEFAEELLYCQQHKTVTEHMFNLFKILATRCSGSFFYQTNDDRQDCVMHAVLIMASVYMKFDFKKDTAGPFAYFTSVAYNGLRAGWNQLNKYNSRTYRIDQIFIED